MDFDPARFYDIALNTAAAGSLSYAGTALLGGTIEKGRQMIKDPSEEENRDTLESIDQRREHLSEALYAPMALFEYGRREVIRMELGEKPDIGQNESQHEQDEDEWDYAVRELED
jgi:hypothetical protein